MENKDTIYYDENTNSWAYVTKVINTKTLQISYEKRTGYLSAIDAATGMQKDMELYQKELTVLKKSSGIEFTFSEYLNYWFNEILSRYAAGNYHMVTGWAVYKVLIPAIHRTRDILLHQVTPAYLNEILKITVPICECAPVQARKILSMSLKDAIANGYIRTNPMDGVDKYPSKPTEIVQYKKEDLKLLLKAAKRDNNYLEILLGAFCGLRPGEVLGLRFSDISIEEKTLYVQRQYTRDYEIKTKNDEETYKTTARTMSIKPPKNLSSYRKIKIPDFILQELEIRKEQNKELFQRRIANAKVFGDYVCISRYGTIKSDGTILSALKRITQREGLPPLSAYDLRHLFATMLIENGVEIEQISKLMGHKSINTTIQTYIGILDSMDQTRNYIETNLDPMYAVGKREQ